MPFFRPPDPLSNNSFYSGMISGALGGYIWGKEKRFNPDRLVESPSLKKHFIDILARHLSAEETVLDIGCGCGTFTPFISPICDQYVGMDISSDLLLSCRGVARDYDLNNVTLTNGSADCLPFASNSFDKLVVVDVIHHIYNLEAAIHEFRRVLKPGGRALVFEPNKLNFALALLCLFDRNEWGALGLGSKAAYRKLFSPYFKICKLEYNGLLIGPDSKLGRSMVDTVNSQWGKVLLQWLNPKLFMVFEKEA
ncbi:MAG: class I SAM-dependent methyltransferase [Pseudodesulfovibrio sp.]|nr:class I SAM-dependent methyltransferase [Pseudodesulfovibrio sp.]